MRSRCDIKTLGRKQVRGHAVRTSGLTLGIFVCFVGATPRVSAGDVYHNDGLLGVCQHLRNPAHIAIGNGKFYVVSQGTDHVVAYDGNWHHSGDWVVRPGTGCRASRPNGIAVAPNGHIYVTVGGPSGLVEFNAQGVEQRRWHTIPLASEPTLSNPGGLAVARDGNTFNLYLADTGNYRVLKLGPDARFLQQWPFRYPPTDLTVAPRGIVYVACAGDPKKNIKGCAYACRATEGLELWTLRERFVEPRCIAVGPGSSVFVSGRGSYGHWGITKMDQRGNVLARIYDWNGEHTAGVTTDVDGRVYYACDLNHWVRRFRPAGKGLLRGPFEPEAYRY
ncbi:MAG: hypothetical protein KKI08_01010 [Armatimonadetes bacterium]|nr:hypothetical protein [Armatimonadota bacterium]